MDFEKVIRERRSVRKFTDKEVSETDIKKLIDVCGEAPSAGNIQAIDILVVKDKKKREAIANVSYNQTFIASAPVIFIIFANKREPSLRYGKRGEFYAIQDATIYGTYLMLAAKNLGLGSCWIGSFDPKKIKDILEADLSMEPIAIVPIGYAKEIPTHPGRKDTDKYVFREVFE